ncbi:hypothetical protein FA10DRAFT_162895 [Acaromyces ingoldii]|uniref:Uncharacterized protein n=1 Tax=Acaromyces ingoldii TaxID=215250 RepID=A0A316YH61_9BASI|nr:hypothetical protein FA10DRAFT_162895 [Acaromyces ingoldii]PWN88416.1 hypothetical protein FA10DRAFT_162895 [Acaromyces ingoldii]
MPICEGASLSPSFDCTVIVYVCEKRSFEWKRRVPIRLDLGEFFAVRQSQSLAQELHDAPALGPSRRGTKRGRARLERGRGKGAGPAVQQRTRTVKLLTA